MYGGLTFRLAIVTNCPRSLGVKSFRPLRRVQDRGETHNDRRNQYSIAASQLYTMKFLYAPKNRVDRF